MKKVIKKEEKIIDNSIKEIYPTYLLGRLTRQQYFSREELFETVDDVVFKLLMKLKDNDTKSLIKELKRGVDFNTLTQENYLTYNYEYHTVSRLVALLTSTTINDQENGYTHKRVAFYIGVNIIECLVVQQDKKIFELRISTKTKREPLDEKRLTETVVLEEKEPTKEDLKGVKVEKISQYHNDYQLNPKAYGADEQEELAMDALILAVENFLDGMHARLSQEPLLRMASLEIYQAIEEELEESVELAQVQSNMEIECSILTYEDRDSYLYGDRLPFYEISLGIKGFSEYNVFYHLEGVITSDNEIYFIKNGAHDMGRTLDYVYRNARESKPETYEEYDEYDEY